MPATVRECPHCYTRVAFKEDGVCPACAKKLSDVGADSTKTLFTISKGLVLPPMCILCGNITNRRVSIGKANLSPGLNILQVIWTSVSLCLAVIVGGLLHLIVRDEVERKHPYQRIRVSVPFCNTCQRSHGLPSPERVDFEKWTMSFVVSKAVAVGWSSTDQLHSPASLRQTIRSKAIKHRR